MPILSIMSYAARRLKICRKGALKIWWAGGDLNSRSPGALLGGQIVRKTQTRNHSQSRPQTLTLDFSLNSRYKNISGFMKIILKQLPGMVQDAEESLLGDYYLQM